MMRSYNTKNWVSLLDDALNQLNSRRMTRNGGIPPKEINSYLQDPVIRKAREEHGNKFPEQDRSQELKTEEKFENSKQALHVGSYVFLDHKPKGKLLYAYLVLCLLYNKW